MPLLSYAHSSAAIRAAEAPLLESQSQDDELMISAAHAVARAATAIITSRPLTGHAERVLILAGAGGNGGDGLYAGASLASSGLSVDALLLGREGKAHGPALDAFRRAGGQVLDSLDREAPARYVLVIDAILGIGGSGGLSEETAIAIETTRNGGPFVLSVDIPSGIDADTGSLPPAHEISFSKLGLGQGDERARSIPAHIEADATITFGGLRYAHALADACGQVLLAEVSTGKGDLSTELLRRAGEEPLVFSATALGTGRKTPSVSWPADFVLPATLAPPALEPGVDDDKYSGGVVGIAAGSGTYPGAAILAVSGAVRATSAMVRYAGPQDVEVVRAHPEVVATSSISDAGQVQSWVFGPGSGTGAHARDNLAELLEKELPLLIDADGLTLLANHPELVESLQQREAITVLTPHAGEFERLAQSAAADIPPLKTDRLGAVSALVKHWNVTIVLKGRHTIVAAPGDRLRVTVVDTGNSWAATPGSGDVLAGLMGAYMAWQEAHGEYEVLDAAVAVHALAAYLASMTPDGAAPTTASQIAAKLPQAWARAHRMAPEF